MVLDDFGIRRSLGKVCYHRWRDLRTLYAALVAQYGEDFVKAHTERWNKGLGDANAHNALYDARRQAGVVALAYEKRLLVEP